MGMFSAKCPNCWESIDNCQCIDRRHYERVYIPQPVDNSALLRRQNELLEKQLEELRKLNAKKRRK